jgi:prepilin-type processing-associated H-X9-DG protein
MYTHDNHDLFPPNMDDGNTILGYTWCAGQGGIRGSAEFNPDLLLDPTRCLIISYLGTNVGLFRCTADSRAGVYQGTNASQVGTIVPAARSISMSQAVGTADACFALNCSGHCGVPYLAVVGPWLSGNHVCWYGSWRTYGTTSSMVIPGPASIWVITEEDPWSINDASFGMEVGLSQWIDYPSTLHNRGCVLTFGDGHVELRKWVSQYTRAWTSGPSARTVPSNDPDWSWMASRTSTLR